MKEPPIVCKPRSAPAVSAARPASRAGWRALIDSRPAMLGMLFGVTGFLGIPFLWMSEGFSRTEKIVWSIVVTIYTLILIGVAVAICWWSYTQITQLLG
ncbi:MAG: hypothetical protein ABI557_16305 [Aureliella sp.]